MVGLAVLVLFALPLVVNYSQTYLVALVLSYGVAVLGYSLLFGHTGLLSFGHAAYFGAGAYAVVLGIHHAGVTSLLALLAAGVLAGGLVSAVIGAVSIRSTDIYYALVTFALAQVLYFLVVYFRGVTGGTNGLGVGLPTFPGLPVASLSGITYLTQFYYFGLVLAFVAVALLVRRVVRSPFGLVLRTIRENPTRAAAIGVRTTRYKWYATVLSGAVTALGGALYAVVVGHVTPEVANWFLSADLVFMSLLGGPTTIVGPILGAGVFVLLTEVGLALFSEYWRFSVGLVLFVVVVTLRDRGVWGTVRDLAGGEDRE